MNDYVLSVLLGILEGITEFLPVSSTAHLRIAEAAFGIDLQSGYWKMYTIVIQLGAILALPIYFRHRITDFLRTFPRGLSGDRNTFTHPFSLVLIAFVFTAVPSFLMTRIIGENLESLTVIGISLVAGGVVMWLIDARYATRFYIADVNQMSLRQAIWIGACQTLAAVFPGTSRSMATIAAGQLAGMSRAAALEFSFFLSMPTMAAATIYDLLKSLRPEHVPGSAELGVVDINAHGWVVLAIGFVVSFVVAYVVVAWFMRWVQSKGFLPFAVYRIVFGIIVLVWTLT